MKIMFLVYKKNKLFFSVPLLMMFIVLPAVCIFYYNKDTEQFWSSIIPIFNMFISLFSTWWTIMIFKDFLESDGNELLYIYHRPYHLLIAHSLFLILYCFVIALFFSVFQMLIEVELFFLFQLIAEAITIGFMSYFLCIILQNTGISMLVVTTYCIYINIFDHLKVLSFMSIFPTDMGKSSHNIELIKNSILFAFLLLFSGYIISKFRRTFK